MSIPWLHAAPTALAAFLAAFVEFVEALTVVLAVGAVRGWGGALGGAGLALAVLAALVGGAGPVLIHLPQGPIHLVLGILLLVFGLRWLRKAILRAAGRMPLRDEAAAYARSTAALGRGSPRQRLDREAVMTTFQVTMVEGLEVVFLVAGMGAAGAGLLLAASLGAGAALLAVMALGVVLHRPLAMVPENTLKLVVGVLVCALGTFWTGEGLGLTWPGGDWALLGLNGIFLSAVFVAVGAVRRRSAVG